MISQKRLLYLNYELPYMKDTFTLQENYLEIIHPWTNQMWKEQANETQICVCCISIDKAWKIWTSVRQKLRFVSHVLIKLKNYGMFLLV